MEPTPRENPPRSYENIPLQSYDNVRRQPGENVPQRSSENVLPHTSENTPLQSFENIVLQPSESIPQTTVESHWETIFKRLDTEGTGHIPISRLGRQLSENNRGVPAYAVRQIITLADDNRDGFLTYPEFLRIIESAKSKPWLQASLQSYIRTFVPHHFQRSHEAVDGSYEQEYTCDPPAVTMILFSVLMILIYIFDKVSAHDTVSPKAFFFSIFVYNPFRRIEVWRFVTYMFVHASELHIAVNICIQIMLGIPLEMVHKWWRILIIYLCGVLSGSLFTSIVDPKVFLAGASGGVYSLLAAHIATIVLNWGEMDYPFLQLAIFLLLAVVDTGNAIYYRYVVKVETKIAYAAHLAGAGAGFLVGIYVLRNLKEHPWERLLWWISFILFNFLIVSAILWNILYSSYFLDPYSERNYSP